MLACCCLFSAYAPAQQAKLLGMHCMLHWKPTVHDFGHHDLLLPCMVCCCFTAVHSPPTSSPLSLPLSVGADLSDTPPKTAAAATASPTVSGGAAPEAAAAAASPAAAAPASVMDLLSSLGGPGPSVPAQPAAAPAAAANPFAPEAPAAVPPAPALAAALAAAAPALAAAPAPPEAAMPPPVQAVPAAAPAPPPSAATGPPAAAAAASVPDPFGADAFFAAAAGPPPIQPVGDVAAWFRKLCTSTSGILYEDAFLQVPGRAGAWVGGQLAGRAGGWVGALPEGEVLSRIPRGKGCGRRGGLACWGFTCTCLVVLHLARSLSFPTCACALKCPATTPLC